MSSSLVELPAKQPSLWISINCPLKTPATLAGKSMFLCFFEKSSIYTRIPCDVSAHCSTFLKKHPIGLFVTCHWCFGLKNGIFGVWELIFSLYQLTNWSNGELGKLYWNYQPSCVCASQTPRLSRLFNFEFFQVCQKPRCWFHVLRNRWYYL